MKWLPEQFLGGTIFSLHVTLMSRLSPGEYVLEGASMSVMMAASASTMTRAWPGDADREL